MESVLRALTIYALLLVIFRISGKRSVAQITTFDLVLTLVISEAIQQALVVDDSSITTAMVLVVTLVATDVALSLAKQRWKGFEKVIEGTPVILVERGALHEDRMHAERVGCEEILGAAREMHGLERLDQIKYAVVEQNGRITIVPRSSP